MTIKELIFFGYQILWILFGAYWFFWSPPEIHKFLVDNFYAIWFIWLGILAFIGILLPLISKKYRAWTMKKIW